MKYFTSNLFALSGVLAAAQERRGSPEQPAGLRALVARSPKVPRDVTAEYAINTYIHVITTESKEGLYPRSMIDQQVSANRTELHCCLTGHFVQLEVLEP